MIYRLRFPPFRNFGDMLAACQACRPVSPGPVAANFGVLGETTPMKVWGVTKQPHDGVLSVAAYLYLQNNHRPRAYYYHLLLLLLPHRQLLCRAF